MTTIEVRNRWLYNDSDECICCPGKHAFGRGADVVSSEVRPVSGNDIASHVLTALSAFGDEAELIIEILRK